MPIRTLLLLATYFVLFIQGCFFTVLLGDEREKPKRIPIVTMALVAINIAIFAITLIPLEKQDSALSGAKIKLLNFLEEEPAFLDLDDVQKKLADAEIVADGKLLGINYWYPIEPGNDAAARKVLGDKKIQRFNAKLDDMIGSYQSAMRSHIFYQYGLAPNGK